MRPALSPLVRVGGVGGCHSERSACPEYALSFAKGLSKEGIS